jgi:hypothetical protein
LDSNVLYQLSLLQALSLHLWLICSSFDTVFHRGEVSKKSSLLFLSEIMDSVFAVGFNNKNNDNNKTEPKQDVNFHKSSPSGWAQAQW